MRIQFFENVSHSPAWGYIGQAMTELRENGLAQEPHAPIAYNDGVLCGVHENGELMGWIIYRPDDTRNSWWILNSYTMPGDRAQGIFHTLFSALVERARLREITSIDSGTHINNVVAQRAFKSQGRDLVGYLYTYPVSDKKGKSHLDIK